MEIGRTVFNMDLDLKSTHLDWIVKASGQMESGKHGFDEQKMEKIIYNRNSLFTLTYNCMIANQKKVFILTLEIKMYEEEGGINTENKYYM